MMGSKKSDQKKRNIISSGTANIIYRIGGISALVVVAFMPIQMAVFVMYSLPTTVLE
jgi:hypothetical protein